MTLRLFVHPVDFHGTAQVSGRSRDSPRSALSQRAMSARYSARSSQGRIMPRSSSSVRSVSASSNSAGEYDDPRRLHATGSVTRLVGLGRGPDRDCDRGVRDQSGDPLAARVEQGAQATGDEIENDIVDLGCVRMGGALRRRQVEPDDGQPATRADGRVQRGAGRGSGAGEAADGGADVLPPPPRTTRRRRGAARTPTCKGLSGASTVRLVRSSALSRSMRAPAVRAFRSKSGILNSTTT
jgi:hypothetical protein